MKKIFFCFFVFSLWSVSLFADDECYRITLPAEGFHLSLDGYYVGKVINSMDEDTLIGFVQTGMLNTRRIAAFTNTITDEIGRVLMAGLPKSPGAVPLLIRINKLDIFEITTSNKENAFAEISLSFFRIEGPKTIWMYDAGTMIRKWGLDVTHSHPENILNGIRACFSKFRIALQSNQSFEREVTVENLQNNPVKEPSVYKVFNTMVIPKGVFHTFEDFRDCRPDTTVPFTIQYTDRKVSENRKVRLVLQGTMEAQDLWGFSDGISAYMRITKKDFYILTREPSAFSSKVAPRDLSDLGSAYTAAGMLGGLIGVALVAAVSATTYNPTESGDYKVDFCFGDLIPSTKMDLFDFDSHLKFVLSTASDKNDTVCLFINNEYQVKLARGFFYSVTIPHRFKHITAEANANNGIRGEEVIPLQFFYDGFYVLRITRRNGIRFERMGPEMRKQLEGYQQEWNTVRRNKDRPLGCGTL